MVSLDGFKIPSVALPAWQILFLLQSLTSRPWSGQSVSSPKRLREILLYRTSALGRLVLIWASHCLPTSIILWLKDIKSTKKSLKRKRPEKLLAGHWRPTAPQTPLLHPVFSQGAYYLGGTLSWCPTPKPGRQPQELMAPQAPLEPKKKMPRARHLSKHLVSSRAPHLKAPSWACFVRSLGSRSHYESREILDANI